MLAQRWKWIAWPAFLAAAIMEMVVFAFVDPGDIAPVGWSRNAVYTLAFFVFWGVTLFSSYITCLLSRSAQELNHGMASEPLVE